MVEHSAAVIRQFRETMKCIFLCMESTDLDFGGQPPIAPYAVIFHVRCDVEYRAIALANATLEFVKQFWDEDSGSREIEEIRSFDLCNICYKFTDFGIYGVMFYGKEFKLAYEEIKEDAACGIHGYALHRSWPVVFWPFGRTIATGADMYASMIQRTRYVAAGPLL